MDLLMRFIFNQKENLCSPQINKCWLIIFAPISEWIDGSPITISSFFRFSFLCAIVYLATNSIFCQLMHVQFIRSFAHSFKRRPPLLSIIFVRAFETSESLPNDDLIFLDCINCLFALFARLVLIFFLNISSVLCACECLWLFYRFSISNKNPFHITKKEINRLTIRKRQRAGRKDADSVLNVFTQRGERGRE